MRATARLLAPLLLTIGLLAGTAGAADAAPRPGKCWDGGYYNQATTVANPEVDLSILALEEMPRFDQTRCAVAGARIVITVADTPLEVDQLRHSTMRRDRDPRAERLYCLAGDKAYSVELLWMSSRVPYKAGEVPLYNAWATRFAARRGCERAAR